jgi:hypothetical protein
MESYKSVVALSLILSAMAIALPASAAQLTAKTAILVHGAFADGSSWQKVIPYLENAGLKVIAVQNPLDSLENDVAATNMSRPTPRTKASRWRAPLQDIQNWKA